MPRLLLDGEWYDPLSADAVFETDYESLLVQEARHIYPSHRILRFKHKIRSEYGNGIPDLALVDRDYRSWWVVEVELGSHPLEGHVRQQVEIFANGEYGQDSAEAMLRSDPSLDGGKVQQMLLGAPPRVLVLVNQARPDWTSWLRKYDALVGVVEIFRARSNRMILRVNGQHPDDGGDVLSRCTLDPWIPKALIVLSPANLPTGEDTLDIEFDGAASRWRRLDSSDKVWLVPVNRSPLPSKQREFDLHLEAGRLSLRIPPSSRNR